MTKNNDGGVKQQERKVPNLVAMRQGQLAAVCREIKSCPYRKGSPMASGWLHGYEAGKRIVEYHQRKPKELWWGFDKRDEHEKMGIYRRKGSGA